MEKIEIFKNLLEVGAEVVFVYNGQIYNVGVVYNKKGIVCAHIFNDIEYETIEDLLENASINNIPLKFVIPNATDIYED